MDHLKSLDLFLLDDDKFHIEILKKKLVEIGVNSVVSASNFEEAEEKLEYFYPSLALIDYYLDGGQNGIEFAKQILRPKKIPFIFISSFYEESIFKDMVTVEPLDFISKNVTKFELQKTLILNTLKTKNESTKSVLSDYLFLKSGKDVKKVHVSEIEYISVEGKYLKISAINHLFMIRSSLNEFVKRLPTYFIKIHQAHVVNINCIELIKVEEMLVKIGKTQLSMSRNHKKELFNIFLIS